MDNKEVQLTSKQNNIMALKYFLFSISAGVIQILATTILNTVADLDNIANLNGIFGSNYDLSGYGLAYLIGLILSVIWNFTINRKFTFKSAVNVTSAMIKVLCFYVVFAPLSVWWTVKLTDIGWSWIIVQVGTMVINFITEYLFWRFVVYKGQIYTNEEGQKELRENGQLKDDGE